MFVWVRRFQSLLRGSDGRRREDVESKRHKGPPASWRAFLRRRPASLLTARRGLRSGPPSEPWHPAPQEFGAKARLRLYLWDIVECLRVFKRDPFDLSSNFSQPFACRADQPQPFYVSLTIGLKSCFSSRRLQALILSRQSCCPATCLYSRSPLDRRSKACQP